MGTVGDALDIAVGESFFASMQRELQRHNGATYAGLGQAMFSYVETFLQPDPRHLELGYLSPSTTNETAPRAA